MGKPKINYWMISALILAVLFIGNLGVYVFFVYQTNQPTMTITPTLLPPANEFTCSQDSDCVTGIQAASCCGCPQAVNKELIGTNDWQLYEPGKDYSSQKPEVCDRTGVCLPCEALTQPICQNSQCRFSLDQSVSSGNPTDLFEYIGKVENSKLQYAQLEAWNVEINTNLLTDKNINTFRINLLDDRSYEVERDGGQMDESTCDTQQCTWIGYIKGRSCVVKNIVTGKCSPGGTITFILNNDTIVGSIPAVVGINQYAYSVGGMIDDTGPFLIKIDPSRLGPD